jgi:transposase
VVDLGVVAFAQQGAVLQAGLALVADPFEQVVDVGLAPISRTPSQWLRGHGRGVVVGRVFSQEFRDQIVALHERDGRTFAEIGAEFGLSPTSVANWVRAADKASKRQRAAPAGESDAARIARLERELAKKDEELEILGKALAFFARRSER